MNEHVMGGLLVVLAAVGFGSAMLESWRRSRVAASYERAVRDLAAASGVLIVVAYADLIDNEEKTFAARRFVENHLGKQIRLLESRDPKTGHVSAVAVCGCDDCLGRNDGRPARLVEWKR